MALRKCPNLKITPPDFSLYSEYSKAFKDICRQYSPSVEEFSIDECFLDMSGMEHLYPDIIKTAYELKDRIKNELGFTVNVGVGSNKLLAKMASDFEKPDKVHTLFDDEIEEKMWPLPVRDLLFLGKASAQKLESLYIRTIGDLAHSDINVIKSMLGNKAGEQMHSFANGIDNSPVESKQRQVKSYGHSITVDEDVTDFASADRLLLALSDAAASRMRADGARAYNVCVTIRDNHFKTKTHQRQSEFPTDITKDIYDVSKELLREAWNGKSPLRLIGVSLGDITKESGEQLSLFGSNNDELDKKRNLDAAVDSIRNKFGDSKILLGSTINTRRPKKK